MGALPDSSLIAKKLADITTRYVASPSFLSTIPAINVPLHLKTLPLIYGSVDDWVFQKAQQQHIIHIEKGMQIKNGLVMRQAALAGLGITRLSDIYCNAHLESGELIEVLPDWTEETPINLICPPNRYQLNRVRVLSNWLAEHFNCAYQALLTNKKASI